MRWQRPTAAQTTVRLVELDAWNVAHPIGTAVEVTRDDGSLFESKTRSAAWLIGSVPVVQVEGISGCYALSRVHTPTEEKPTP